MQTYRSEEVRRVAARILGRLESRLDDSSTKRILANLRHSIGANFSQTVGIWPDVFSQMPEEFLSRNGYLTKEEKAIFTALQLFALHQQGHSQSVNEKPVENEETQDKKSISKNAGDSLRCLRRLDSTSIDKRFNAMITAATYEEMVTHLRHLVSILKSKTEEKIDYALLAADLFKFQINQREQVRLSWGQSYYKSFNIKEDNHE